MPTPAETRSIKLSSIDLPSDARSHNPEDLEKLTRAMQAEGQLQEIIVEAKGDRFLLLAGGGRVLAARSLKWETIRASVREGLSDFERARITFAENEDREEVDAFYQSALITKMFKAKGGSQQSLARELGISDGLLSAYLAIDQLPNKVKTFKRLKVGQLIQIARLNESKMQIRMAEKCAENDLSVRQLKALVDHKLAKMSGAKGETKPDPLANTFKMIRHFPNMAPEGSWGFHFGPRKADKGNPSGYAWTFWVGADFNAPQARVLKWLKGMKDSLQQIGDSQALKKTADEALAHPMSDKQFKKFESRQERLGKEQDNPRLPQNAKEQAEVEALASQGPAAVYAWIYGKDSLSAEEAVKSKVTWKNFDAATPLKGVRELLKGVKALRDFDPEKFTKQMMSAVSEMARGKAGKK